MIYGAGAAMGFTPQQVDEMSMWQWLSAYHGFVAANSPAGGAKLTEVEADDLFAWIESGAPDRMLTTPTYTFDDAGHLVPAGIVSFTPS